VNRFTLTERICISIGAKTIKELSTSINKALELSDFLDIRFDILDQLEIPSSLKIIESIKSKSIFTVRSREQQGKFNGNELERLKILKMLYDTNPMLLDVEYDTIRADHSLNDYLKDKSNVLISWHNFLDTPSN
jgi:3-dehydroquinate dehydratase-1